MPPLSRTAGHRASAMRPTRLAGHPAQWPHAALLGVLVSVLLLAAAGCSADPAPAGTHSHAGGVQVSLPVGDGTEPDRGRLLAGGRRGLGERGRDRRGQLPRRELRGRRHRLRRGADPGPPPLRRARRPRRVPPPHPTLADDGTWSAPLSLPASGDYRVITEFVARDEGGNGDHVILGETVPVGGDRPTPRPTSSRCCGWRPSRSRSPGQGRLVLPGARRPGPPGAGRDLPRDVRPRDRLPADGGTMVHMHPLGVPRHDVGRSSPSTPRSTSPATTCCSSRSGSTGSCTPCRSRDGGRLSRGLINPQRARRSAAWTPGSRTC